MIIEEDIVKGFRSGFDCSMIVLAELAEDVGITKEQGLRIASCFGAGMMQGSLCGAVTGAMMAIGCRFGNDIPDDKARKGLVISKRDEFIAAFTERFGTISCPALIGLDLRVPEEMEKANERKVLTDVCPKFVKGAIEICREQIL